MRLLRRLFPVLRKRPRNYGELPVRVPMIPSCGGNARLYERRVRPM